MLGAAAAGAKAAGAQRVVYVMTDGAALPSWFSEQVHELREAGLLDTVVTTGQALGGDIEAVNVFSGLLAARAVAEADVVVVADGPGKVGTGTRWGASDVSSGMSLNAAGILGGRPIAIASPELRRSRLPSPCRLAPFVHGAGRRWRWYPSTSRFRPLKMRGDGMIWEALKEAGLEERHQLVEVGGQPALDLLAERGVSARDDGT